MAARKSVEIVVPAAEAVAETAQTVMQAAAKAAEQRFEPTAGVPKDDTAGTVAGIATPHIETTHTEIKTKMDNAMKTAEELVSFGQGNVEAVMKSGQIWAAGVQDLSKSFAATAQAQFEQTMATWKALAGVRSLKEVMDLQTSLARSSMEAAMAESGKLTDASMKLAEQTFAPITARVTLAVEKFGRAA